LYASKYLPNWGYKDNSTMQSHMFAKYNVRFIKLSIRGSEDKLFVKKQYFEEGGYTS
jgi:hypothetical protein